MMSNQTNRLVVTIGELLIDFFCTDINVDMVNGSHFLKQAGGAPANVASTIAKLGGYAAFVGKVGNDPFGDFLERTLVREKVDTTMLIKDDNTPTTLAFVSLHENGERDFFFNRGADGLLKYEELKHEKLKKAKIIHFGSATALLEDPFRETYFYAMNDAKEHNIFISFDPNYRSDLWKGREQEFINFSKKGVSIADFVKLSEEELKIITESSDRTKAIKKLHDLGAKVVTVTLGREGTLLSLGEKQLLIRSVNVKSVDSTGAGDAFVGAMLFQLANTDDPSKVIYDYEKLKEMIFFANKTGAIVCTRVGAISALPRYDEVMLTTLA